MKNFSIKMKKSFSTSKLKLALLLLILNLLSPAFAKADVEIIDGFVGRTYSRAWAVNADGTVVVGDSDSFSSRDRAFRWTSVGIQDLGVLPGGDYSYAYGVNTDGTVIIGYSDSFSGDRAFRWTSAGMQDLGVLPGGTSSYAYGVNADGTVVVGYGNSFSGTRAFRWTSAGMQDLGVLPGGTSSNAQGVNADGTVVVGSSGSFSGIRAFRWTSAGMQDLGVLPGGTSSNAWAVNADGTVIIGYSDSLSGTRAFRWTSAGMQDLGVLSGGNYSYAYGVNADGTVVVGYGNSTSGTRAFRWTSTDGMQSVEDWLRANGVTLATDITYQARAVNASGNVIVGDLSNNQAFIARVAPKEATHIGSGIIGLKDTFESLATITPAPVLAAEAAELVLNGIHGHSLSNRIQNGQNGFWLSGDWGAERKLRDGIAEVGLSKLVVSQWQAGLGLGRTLRRQRLNFNGRQNFNGIYTLAEILGKLPFKNLWLTLNSFFHWGNIENRRGYINAGNLDKSCGRSDSFSKAFRARLDWDKLLAIKDFSFTPYGQYAISFAKQKAYTESGGGFPAFYHAKKQHVQEARIGINGELAFTKRISFLSTIEGVHRFEKKGPNTTGHLLELVGFDIPGRKYKQDWLRGSIGLQGPIGQGLAMLFLNATTIGEDIRMWVGASYHLNF